MPRPKTRRRYIEQAECILTIGSFMRDRVKDLAPGSQFHDVLPSGYKVRLDCQPDAIYLHIGNDRQTLRTYKIGFDPIPQTRFQRCQYIRWVLTDATGRRVFQIFHIDKEIGSRHELRLFRQSNSENAAKRQERRQRNWQRKHAPNLLDPSKPIMSVVQEKPPGQWLSTWIREVVRGRHGGNIYRDIQEQFDEAITLAENEYQTIKNRRRFKYRNLEEINQRRHREKIMRQQRVEDGIDEPILGFRT
jgi:hypothetical protein